MLKAILKTLLALVLVLAGGLFLVIKYGIKETRYECDGTLSNNNASLNTKLFLKTDMYRPFIVWADSDGMVWAEIPEVGTNLYEATYMPPGIRLYDKIVGSGSLSDLSKALELGFAGGTFKGMCKELKE